MKKLKTVLQAPIALSLLALGATWAFIKASVCPKRTKKKMSNINDSKTNL